MKYLAVLLALLLPTTVFASWAVWTEPMLADKPQPTYNPTTKSPNISLKGAKNEWVGFLVCVRGTETLAGFTPSVTATLTSGTNTIADSNFIPYILFNHTTTERANAYEVPGTYPDAAVPYKDVYYNEIRNGTEAGWGQTVGANTTRVFFVEIYVPSATVAGTYTGTFRLASNSGALTQDIPITLKVWDFTLPQEWSLKNIWGVYGGYWAFIKTALGAVDYDKAREYLFNMQKAAINHGIFLHGNTGLLTSGPTTNDSFVNSYFDGTNDTYSWKRFLDGTVPQGYNPQPYKKTKIFGARDESGGALISKSTTTMDAWASWIASEGYSDVVFLDILIDEPNLAAINPYHTAHVTRHSGHPNRPYEFWTAGNNAYPTESDFWGDTFQSLWIVSQYFVWYSGNDLDPAPHSPSDFDSRRAKYGDILFSYTAGDNDTACNRDLSFNAGKNIRTAASSSLDAYSRQNAYMFLSDWHFGTTGHHFWTVNEGWQHSLAVGSANGSGNFSIPIPQRLDNGTYSVKAFWVKADTTTGLLYGTDITVSSGSSVTSLALPASSSTVGPSITVTGTALANVEVRIYISGTASIDSADYVWKTTDPFADAKMTFGYGGMSPQGYNGDGVYFYPGRVSGTNYDVGGTHDIPIESYKMKLVRWGAQVYEYAKLLEGRGAKAIADTQIGRMITFNVPTTITIHSVQVWEDARNTMGDAISPSIKPVIYKMTPNQAY